MARILNLGVSRELVEVPRKVSGEQQYVAWSLLSVDSPGMEEGYETLDGCVWDSCLLKVIRIRDNFPESWRQIAVSCKHCTPTDVIDHETHT